MKNIYLCFFCMICVVTTSAQLTVIDTVPPYKKDQRIPAFAILQPDSTWFTKEQLPRYDYTVIIYFAPDCDHCQYEATEIVKNMDSLKNVFFVFVAYKSLEDIKDFYIKYGLNNFSNIRAGRDPKYYIPSFFRVEYTPFVAVYDRNGMFIKAYEKGVEATDLIALLRKN